MSYQRAQLAINKPVNFIFFLPSLIITPGKTNVEFIGFVKNYFPGKFDQRISM